MKKIVILSCLAITLSLSACGVKGPLYLPDEAEQSAESAKKLD